MTVENPRNNSWDVAARTGGAALGLLVGLAFAGPLGAGVGTAIGTIGTPALETWISRCIAEFQEYGHELAAGAADAAHIPEDEVVQRVLEDQTLQPLVRQVVDAASRTASFRKLRALGAVLGEAVTSRPRRVDEDLLIVAALRDLEAAHLRVLEVLERQANPNNPNIGWTRSSIESAISELTDVGRQAALGGLVSHGLVATTSLFGNIGYELTDFGSAMIQVLRMSAPEGDSHQ